MLVLLLCAGSKYAYTMTGNVYGDLATAGGYVGIASYLNTGDVPISTQTNNVYVASGDSGYARVDRSGAGGSTIGAPAGPFTACISERTASGACGAARTFAPSAYKFSIFGHLSGAAPPPSARARTGFRPGWTTLASA
jgi:hypothetical protein